MYPRREVFYVRTTVRLIRPDRNHALEHDLLAVRVELARLWLLFVPTVLAVAFLVFFAAGGPAKFSSLNWILSSRFAFIALTFCFISALARSRAALRLDWREKSPERRRSVQRKIFHLLPLGKWANCASLLPVHGRTGEHGEYYSGDCMYFGLVHRHERGTIVFHNVRKPELNKIAMGFFFHRLIVFGAWRNRPGQANSSDSKSVGRDGIPRP